MKNLTLGLLMLIPLSAVAEPNRAIATVTELVVEMHAVDKQGVGDKIGEVRITQGGSAGLALAPHLFRLQPGMHGFHVHANFSCAPAMKDGKPAAAADAGGHFDPLHAEKHAAPWMDGHLGDLPALFVSDDGTAVHPVYAPRLSLDELYGRSLIIHANGDNYDDQPQPLGGGGERVACGLIGKP